jgi:hypothetical protein
MPAPDITAHQLLGRYKGEFLGHALMAREICVYVDRHWPNQRIKGTAVVLSESKGRMGAYNYNYNKRGEVVSKDCGPWQDNITASQIGTEVEGNLRTLSTDPREIDRVMTYGTKWAYNLWITKNVFRDGKLDYRRWGPWVGATSGWAWFQLLYAWHHEVVNGVSVPAGPWVETARNLHKAIRGVANWLWMIKHSHTTKQALEFAQYQANYWNVPEDCQWKFDNTRGVYFIPGPKPTKPPTEEDNWGYPYKNDGR